MTNWPSLDLHTHVDATIDPRALLDLRAVVFAASRSIEESNVSLERQSRDLLTVWGVGVHPGVREALETYNPSDFCSLVERTAYVGEVGLDSKVASRLGQQREVLESVLAQLQKTPRLTSIHSYGATVEVVAQLERTPVTGAILHWWLGDRETTSRALELGAYFSINQATLRHGASLDLIPVDRVLPETDHPDGNRGGARPRRPGNVSEVESALASRYGFSAAAFRTQTWRNLASLVATTGTGRLLPPRIASMVEAVG